MTDPKILVASLAAAFLYVVSPGQAFLALFTLAASRGRVAGAKFICGHLVGVVSWGAQLSAPSQSSAVVLQLQPISSRQPRIINAGQHNLSPVW